MPGKKYFCIKSAIRMARRDGKSGAAPITGTALVCVFGWGPPRPELLLRALVRAGLLGTLLAPCAALLVLLLALATPVGLLLQALTLAGIALLARAAALLALLALAIHAALLALLTLTLLATPVVVLVGHDDILS